MRTVTLRPMHAGEFGAFRASVMNLTVDSLITSVGLAAEVARAKTFDELCASLPLGFDTPGHVLLIGESEGERIGAAWFGLRHPHAIAGCGFLHMLTVDPDHRGRGLGRALLSAVEAEARARGCESLELNVFGTDKAAVGLYDTAGYDLITQQLRKRL
ncbi:ribosomal protein S18 acetylase RimI-like enzyme [Catenuloplanes nepalensis]|uniref:Ribosomal protein S18 acetylase RimI-like enzyme n=1 Tax=Catenuloplanes nepalensis TaxID=587533 RepID=A0ABT9MWL7_9ACTN|nr:GNAT family N-acetyltransferase [Catenuloplanes nepalensis]MDP9795833.1 ribosomal protein S18 acetylase RimI-like enzyme [Catenuloplanes nepalensis]